MAKIPTLAVGSRAAAALRGETEPKFCPMGKTLGTHPVRWEKQKGHPCGVLFVFGSGTRIRTQTSRVRVCCATFTQFRYIQDGNFDAWKHRRKWKRMQSLPLGVRFLVGVPLRWRGNLDLLAWQYTACAVCIACCATFTQFRYSVSSRRYYNTNKMVCQ